MFHGSSNRLMVPALTATRNGMFEIGGAETGISLIVAYDRTLRAFYTSQLAYDGRNFRLLEFVLGQEHYVLWYRTLGMIVQQNVDRLKTFGGRTDFSETADATVRDLHATSSKDPGKAELAEVDARRRIPVPRIRIQLERRVGVCDA